MKNNKLLNILVFISLFIFNESAASQSLFDVGIFMHSGSTIHSTNIISFRSNNETYNWEMGKGQLFNFGILTNHDIDDELSISLRFGYNSYDVSFSKLDITEVYQDNKIQSGYFSHNLNVEISEIGISPILNYKLGKIGIMAGLNLSLVNNALFNSHEVLTSQNINAEFVDNNDIPTGSNIRDEQSGQLPKSSQISANLLIGLNYTFQLNEKIQFIPEIYLEHGLISPVTQYDWNYEHINLGFALKYSPRKVKKEIIAPLVSVSLFPVDKDSKNKNSFEYIKSSQTRIIPLLNSIYFNQNETSIPKRYKILDKLQTETYYINNTCNDIIEKYYDILNIIARRMKSNNKGSIRLKTIIFEEDKDISFYLERAESILDYFTNIWNIDSSRFIIDIAKIDPGDYQYQKYRNESNFYKNIIEEQHRIDLIPEDMELIAPIITYDTLKTMITDYLSLMTFVSNPDAINSWQFQLKVNNQRFYDLQGKEFIPNETKIPIPDNFADRIPAKLSYNLKLNTDENNFNFSGDLDFGALEFEEKSISYFLIWRDHDLIKTDNFGTEIAELINLSVSNDTQIEINSYHDNTGFERTNLIRSEARANEFSNLLDSPNKFIKIHDIESALYENDLPEKRAYNRCLEIKLIKK